MDEEKTFRPTGSNFDYLLARQDRGPSSSLTFELLCLSFTVRYWCRLVSFRNSIMRLKFSRYKLEWLIGRVHLLNIQYVHVIGKREKKTES